LAFRAPQCSVDVVKSLHLVRSYLFHLLSFLI
jgi:hypothetical protein